MLNDVAKKMVAKTVGAGSWAVVATVNTRAASQQGDFTGGFGDSSSDLFCTLRNGADTIGVTHDRRFIQGDAIFEDRSVTMNGGAFVPDGGTAEVSVWCQSNGYDTLEHAQMMLLRVGSFS
jgi:hypothetical protein